MLRKVLLTFSTRTLTAFLSVINVLIGTNYLGVEGYGTISLIILGVTIYLLIQNLLTGSSIVYFQNKIPISSIIQISYLWVIVSVIGFAGLIYGVDFFANLFHFDFEIVPQEYALHNILLASGYGLLNIHINILLGRERIKAYNAIFFMQHAIASLFLILFFVVLGKNELFYYLIALYASYFLSFIVSFSLTYQYFRDIKLPSFTDFKSMLNYGILGQGANVFQLINYRLSYYLVDIFVGRASLGVFSAATQMSEGLWILGKSIGTVQFARISNSTDREYARQISLKLFKITVLITAIPLFLFTILPITFYTNLLGPEFEPVRGLVRWLALGTISLTGSMLFSHYFSGTGRIGKNTMASGIGVIITLLFGFSIVPILGVAGAALVTSLSYFTSLCYYIVQFKKEATLHLNDIVLTKFEIKEAINLIFKRKPGNNMKPGSYQD
ncbi:MAG TPA: hypothetical protein DCX54_11510 [Flavobacteriales bacterium]|nr:hypothetical protein [Flavobacteriales bacterium]